MQAWLPALVAAVQSRQSGEAVCARQPFEKAKQRSLSLDVMALLGFDFEAGRLDESAHPSAAAFPRTRG